jgi:hypothetical protein
MPGEPSLPKDLLHLLEKRGARGRRKQDKGLPADAPPPQGVERRRGDRRKPEKSKGRKR